MDAPDGNPSLELEFDAHQVAVSTVLRELKTLKIYLGYVGSADHAQGNSAYMIKNAPKLEDLCIESSGAWKSSIRGERICDAFGGPYSENVAVPPL
jgi:hypothetical protein